jgi:hypothetical protein
VAGTFQQLKNPPREMMALESVCLDRDVCVCLTGTRFVPKAEERLLAVVHALLHRCYKMPFSNNAEVPASLKKELSGMNSASIRKP